jgi:hypothetical protein
MPGAETPPGFAHFTVEGADVVCAPHVVDALRTVLRSGTLHSYAERHPQARPLTGRGAAYAIPLPGDADRVVVRHNRHGGFLAPITRDLFRAPTRAPRELHVAERLREHGVPTPVMLGFVVYAGPAGFKRVDVITREVAGSFDLSAALAWPEPERRAAALSATADLVLVLSQAGARHADLNIKNVLLRRTDAGRLDALVLDVDCVVFGEPGIVLEPNLARLLRSARKWQRLHGARVTDAELAALAGLVRERRGSLTPFSSSS